MRRIIFSLIMWSMAAWGLSACGLSNEQPTAQVVIPQVNQQVTIDHPPNSAVIYAEVLFIGGSIAQDTAFTLQIMTVDDEIIAETQVNATAGNWTVELMHGYTGDPTEVVIQAMQDDTLLASTAILLTDVSYRPEGVYGSILLPENGSEAGGDMILVSGRASGVDTLLVEVIGDDDQVIGSQVVILMNPYFIDEVPWEAALNVTGYTGQAVIRVTADDAQNDTAAQIENPLDVVRITLTNVAG